MPAEPPAPDFVPVFDGGDGGGTAALADGVFDGVLDGVFDGVGDGLGDALGLVVVADSSGRLGGEIVRGADGRTGAGITDGVRRVVRPTSTARRVNGPAANSTGAVLLALGVGLGRGAGRAARRGRSGSGRIALEFTGPPARLTLISPP